MPAEYLRFLQVADLHLNTSPLIAPWKIIEQRDCLTAINEYAAKNSVRDVFVCGDVFDKHNPDSHTLSFFLNWIGEGIDNRVRFWVIPGNHDSSDHLCSIHSMTSIKRTLDAVGSDPSKGLTIFDQPRVVDWPISDFRVYFMPWMRDQEYMKVLKALPEKPKKGEGKKANILVTHCYVKGSAIGDGGVKLQEGIPTKLFTPFHYVALGDVHLRQEFQLRDGIACYPGSLRCNNFGERKEHKGFLDVTVTSDGDSKFEFVRVPHIIWTQRRIKVGILIKLLANPKMFRRKFDGKKLKRKNLKLLIDCESSRAAHVPLDELLERVRELPLMDFKYELKNTGVSRPKRYKSKKTDDMMDEMVDGDDTVKGKKRKKKAKMIGRKLLNETSPDRS